MAAFLRPLPQSAYVERRHALMRRRSYFLWPSQAEAMDGNSAGRIGHRRNAFEVLNELLARRQSRAAAVDASVAPPLYSDAYNTCEL
eukprot:6493464-Prymnesium_polylepis.1